MKIKYTRLIFNQEPQVYEEDLADFLGKEEWFSGTYDHNRFPDRAALNGFLRGGQGGDEWNGSRWAPFELTETEYHEFYREFYERERKSEEESKRLSDLEFENCCRVWRAVLGRVFAWSAVEIEERLRELRMEYERYGGLMFRDPVLHDLYEEVLTDRLLPVVLNREREARVRIFSILEKSLTGRGFDYFNDDYDWQRAGVRYRRALRRVERVLVGNGGKERDDDERSQ